MPFKSGQSGNKSGRPRGAKNKTPLRDKVEEILSKRIEQIERDLDTLDAKDRIQALLKMLDFVLPRLRSQDLHTDYEKLSDEDLNEIVTKIINGNHEAN